MKTPALVATQRILTIQPPLDPGYVSFGQYDEGTGVLATQLVLTQETWEDFGTPEKITLTVEPGDRLNGD